MTTLNAFRVASAAKQSIKISTPLRSSMAPSTRMATASDGIPRFARNHFRSPLPSRRAGSGKYTSLRLSSGGYQEAGSLAKEGLMTKSARKCSLFNIRFAKRHLNGTEDLCSDASCGTESRIEIPHHGIVPNGAPNTEIE